jgi:L-ascorbate metabolism protein UlaG (beta-lactamase superfamily)
MIQGAPALFSPRFRSVLLMRSLFLAAIGFLLSITSGTAADAPVTIRWHGQSFFEVVSPAGVRIVLDPHAIENYGRISVQADLVLLSHFHNDHTQVNVVENIKKARVITGLKDEKGDGRHADWNIVDEKLKDVRVRSVGTFHDNVSGMERGKNGIFVLDVAGLRIVHLGDLGHTLTPEQVRRIGPVDVLMIPVGGVYTLNGSDAKTVVEQLKPRRYIIPMHYGTDVYDDLLPLDEFLDEQKPGTIRKYATNELTIDPKESIPKDPQIAILYWSNKKDDK